MSVHETAVQVLAQFPDPGGQGEDFGKSSPVGLLLLVLFAIAVVLLVRSMTKHLKKLSTSFDEEKALAAAPARIQRAESARRAAETDTDSEPGDDPVEDPGEEADGSRGTDSAPTSENNKE